MSTDVTTYEPRNEVAALSIDPTGGRLIAWAQAALAANALAKSLVTTAFVPRVKVGGQLVAMSAGDATAAILMGDELGLSPLAALRSIYVVHGTPAMYSRTMVALAQGRGHAVWTEESTPAKVTVCAKRRGSEHVERATWTIDRARKAGYTSNTKYQSNPEEMLYAKAAAEVCRKVAADVLAGVPYSVEDLELEQSTTATVTRSEGRRTVARTPKPEPDEPAFPEAEPTPATESVASAGDESGDGITSGQLKKIGAGMRDAGIVARPDALAYVARVIGREVESRNDLTKAEAHQVIEALEFDAMGNPAGAPAEDPT
jgi:hypothetical protein